MQGLNRVSFHQTCRRCLAALRLPLRRRGGRPVDGCNQSKSRCDVLGGAKAVCLRSGIHRNGLCQGMESPQGITRGLPAAVAGFDAVLVPTSPILPPNRKRALEDSEYYTSENLLALRNTRIGNLMDLSSLTIPTGVPSAGIMLLGQPFGEARILRIGAGIETAMAAGSPAG